MKEDLFSEDLIIRYLLGDLPEESLAEIEDRAFSDPHYLREILAVESDLIDEYVRGGLSDVRRRLFESRFLASAERRRKVEFAKSLTTVFGETAVVKKERLPVVARPQSDTWGSLAAFLRGLSPAARLSFATAAVLIVMGSLWVVTEALRLRAQVAELRAERQALENQLADERERGDQLSSRLQNEQQQRERSQEVISELEREREQPASKPLQPTLLSLVLPPGIARSGTERPQLNLLQSARLIRLQIGVEPGDEYQSFRVELRTQAAQQVWSQDKLTTRSLRSGQAIVLSLPAKLLSPGRYELTLEGVTDGGALETVGYYYFDVVRK